MPVHGQMTIPLKARGGAPEYRRQSGVYTPGSIGVPQLSDSAALIAGEAYRATTGAEEGTAKAAFRLGGALENAVKTGVKAYGEYQAALAQNAYNQYEADEIRLKAELNTLQGQNALGEDGVMARLERWREEAREKYAGKLSPMARDLFRRNTRRLDASTDAWAIGKQDRENIVFQNSVSEGAIRNAETLILSEPASNEVYAAQLGKIRAELERQGARNGWDAAQIQAKFVEAAQKLQYARGQSLIAGKDYEGARRLLSVSGRPGSLSASEESGADGHLAIGYDPNGGTSYGRWQLSSKQGSLGEWISLIAGKGEKGAAYVARLRKAGPANTGSRKGAFVDEYKKIASEDPQFIEETQYEYLMKSHYGPALASLNPEQRAMIEKSPPLQEMLFSTAVQHGGGGAARILKGAWKEGLSEADLVRAVYAGRAKGGNFRSTPGGMARNITEGRMPRERDQVLAMLAGEEIKMPPIMEARLKNQIDAAEKRAGAKLRAGLDQRLADYFAAAEDGLAGMPDFDAALLERAYGDKAAKILARLGEAARLSDAVARIKTTDAESMNRVLRELAPESAGEGHAARRAVREKYRTIAERHIKMREKDPAGYLLGANPVLKEEYEAMLQKPEPDAVRLYLKDLEAAAATLKMGNVPIFPAGQAKVLAGKIMASPDPGLYMASLQNAFGQRWPDAFRELSAKDCLPLSAQVIGNGMAGEDAKLLMEGLRDGKFQKEFYQIHKESAFTEKDFQNRVIREMEEFSQTLLAGGDQSSAVELNRAVGVLAMQYVNKNGLDYGDAIEKAAKNVVLDNYSIRAVNGGKFRVPNTFDGDDVEVGAGVALGELAEKADELQMLDLQGLGERAGLLQKKYLQSAGRWVTNGDESGLLLFVGPNVVRDKKGKPVALGWNELLEKGHRAKETERERFESESMGWDY